MNRLEKLHVLKDMLERHDEIFPQIKFDMSDWVDFDEGTLKDKGPWPHPTFKEAQSVQCATAACALGSACYYEPFRKLGLQMDTAGFPISPIWNDDVSCFKFFEIEQHEAEWLFLPEQYRRGRKNIKDPFAGSKRVKITPAMVAARVGVLIEHYRHTPDDYLNYAYIG